jgi:hypothetical protein
MAMTVDEQLAGLGLVEASSDERLYHLQLNTKDRAMPYNLGSFRSLEFGRIAAMYHLAGHAWLRTTRDWTTTVPGRWSFATTGGSYELTLGRASDSLAEFPDFAAPVPPTPPLFQ